MRTILEMVVDFIAFMVVLAIGLGCGAKVNGYLEGVVRRGARD